MNVKYPDLETKLYGLDDGLHTPTCVWYRFLIPGAIESVGGITSLFVGSR